ncbi:MAG: c-type cytochrome, partial [Acidimicrobiia bacterium]
GAAVYAASCVLCHGADGGNLRGNSLALSKISSVVTGGQGSMSGFSGRLSPMEISNVSQYVRSVGTSSGVTTTTAAPGTASGATIYGQQCALCHGADGGNLRGHKLSSSKISSVVAGGQGSMSGFSGRLSPADIDAVSQYVLSVGASSGVTTTTAAPGSTPSGANLFMQNCSGCHGLHGEGGSGGAVAGIGLSAVELDEIIRNGVGSMPGFAGQMSDGELAALVSYTLALASGQEFSSAGTTTTTDTNTQGSGGIAGPQALGGSVPDESASSSPVTVIVVSLLAGLVAAGAAVLWARLGRNLTR